MHYVYIIQSTTSGKYYIGSTNNIDKRLKEHNKNITRSTKYKGPWKLIHKEEFPFKQDALSREKQIKSYKSGRAFKELISSPSSSLA